MDFSKYFLPESFPPRDPSLQVRAVPHKRFFDICSFGLDIEEDELCLEDICVRMIDPKWDYPAQPYPNTIEDDAPYRGADNCPITGLAELYRRMEGDLMKEYPIAECMV